MSQRTIRLSAAAARLAAAFLFAASLPAQVVITNTVSAHEITAVTTLADTLKPVLSRNGARIAFLQYGTQGTNVMTMNSDGTNVRQIDTNCNCGYLDISDDGSLVAWMSTNSAAGLIKLVPSDGSAPARTLFNGGAGLESVRISADNSKVFFLNGRGDGTYAIGVYVVNADGSGLRQIVSAASAAAALGIASSHINTNGFDSVGGNCLDRSNDGSSIVFGVSPDTGGAAVLTATSTGSSVHKLVWNLNQLFSVSISGDGSKVFYIAYPLPSGQPNQAVVTNADGSGAVTLGTNLSIGDAADVYQMSSDGSTVMMGSTGRLYNSDGSGWVLLSAYAGVGYSTDPPSILTDGMYRANMNGTATRFIYLAKDANGKYQIIEMDRNPASTGAAPAISNPTINPAFVLQNAGSATETAQVTATTAPLYRVTHLTLLGTNMPAVDRNGFNDVLYDDGTHGDVTAGNGVFTNNTVSEGSLASLGPRTMMIRAEAKDSTGKRHASALQYVPFSVLKTGPYTFTITTNPPGLSVLADGSTFTGPEQISWDAGDSHTLSAPTSQVVGGKTYTFGSWSDQGAQTHTLSAPAANTTYTATFSGSGGGTCPTTPFTGTFSTNLGTLTVVQNANCTLTGTIPGGPTFTGSVNGTWSGTFTGPQGTGTFTFTAGAGGGFSGPYTYTSGTGTSGVLTATTGSGGGTCNSAAFTGTFSTNLGTLTATSGANCTVTGTIPGGPTFTGSATGTWSGTFTGSQGGGTFTFTSNTGGGFSGPYTYTSGTGTSGILTATPGTGSGSGNCAYNFPATSGVPTPLPGAGFNNLLFSLLTAPTCTWSVKAVDSFITIVLPAPNTTITGGSGVSVSLTANPSSTASRTGTILLTWPGGGGTHQLTQGPGPNACSVTLPSTATPTPFPYTGGPGSFAVTPNPANCSFTATTPNPDWITNLAPSGGNSVTFTVAANGAYPAPARQGTIIVQGQTYTVNQEAAPNPNGPVISAGGVTNAASYASASPPTGGIAQGSYISIFGTKLGPNPAVQATAGVTLSTTLGGVSIKITNGTTSVDVIPTFVAAPQINAIVPSNAPLGNAVLTVTYNGVTSNLTPVRILQNALGIFTLGAASAGIIQTFAPNTPEGQRPLNSSTNTAAPGDYGIVWATGLGPDIVGGQLVPDNQPPPGGQLSVPVTVSIGGVAASIPYSGRAPYFAGVDNVYFIVPSGAPSGCAINVLIQAGALPANTVTIAVDPQRQPCH